jgi:chemotaxis protein MotB
MIRRNRRRQDSHDRWLVSYADFITLLFAFFVVLYAASKADQKKQVQVSEAIDSAFRTLGIFANSSRTPNGVNSAANGVDKPVIPMNIVMGEDVFSRARVQEDLNQIRQELEQKLSNQIAQHTVSIQMGRDGLVISLREAGFFDSGSAEPKPETMATLRQVAGTLGRSPYDLRIEGHTDNIPIHNDEFASNWELSSARAIRIARVFLDLKAVAPERLSVSGYAEFHPVASNDSADGRAENRRVDLVVRPRGKIDFSVPALPRSSGGWRRVTDDH